MTAKTACITGASSGIGEALARELAKNGVSLILVARNAEKLNQLAADLSVPCEVIPCDLSDMTAVKKLGRRLAESSIDVLINNAGFGTVGAFEASNLDQQLKMIDVDVKAPLALTRAVLPMMMARDSGQILNVASVGGLLPGGPYFATYYAAKSAVVSFTGAVAAELSHQHSRVKIQALCPGPVNTAFNETAGVRSPLSGMSAAACAKAAVRGMRGKRLYIVPGALTALGMSLQKLLPRRLMLAAVGATQRKKLR